jgi:NADH-quinone oxidoreductase subunit H
LARPPSFAVSLASAVLVAFLTIFGVGCSREIAPELIQVLDVAPRHVEVGDRVEIVGSGFPQGRTAKVTFRGVLHRPGESGETAEIRTEGSVTSAEQLELPFTEGLEALFCGKGEHAAHTTFEGDVEVAFEAAEPGAPPVVGTLRKVVLDVRPPTARRAVLERRNEEGARVLAHVGLRVAADAPPAGGLVVEGVEAGSLAERAGLLAGDLLVRWNGVRIHGRADVVPPAGVTSLNVQFRRGESPREETRVLELEGYRHSNAADLLGAGVLVAIAAAILLLFMAPTAGIITWVERRVAARMQSRIGPNRAGPQGFFVWIADGIKSLLKEDIVPKSSDRMLFRLAPYLVFLGVSVTFVVMPFGQTLIAADLDVGILFVLAVTSLVTIGLLTGGWASNNKYSLLGGVRSAAQIVSYEVPAALAIACIVLMTGSLRMQDIVRAQGGMPWDWFLFRNPVTFGLFFLYFTTALAEGNRAPFDLPEAESELVAGYSTEYSGMRYLFFFFAEWANVFVMSGLAAALFLGGWQLPGVAAGTQEAHVGLQLLGALVFLLKSWTLIFVVIWVRWTLPRVRIDQMMALCWKFFVPLAFAAFLLTAGWVLWSPGRPVQLLVSGAMVAIFCLGLLHFAQRVRYNLRATGARVHLNPFL